jgi:hypothetical protein
MEEERIPKKVLNGNFHTTRPVGRPRTRWADVVQRDAQQLLCTRGCRRRAANRDEWRRLMREAKARRGCSAIGGWKVCVLHRVHNSWSRYGYLMVNTIHGLGEERVVKIVKKCEQEESQKPL